MANVIVQTLLNICTPESLLLMAGGVAVGTLFGAIPGLSGAIAIAIFLPISFYLDPLPAMALLIGIYVGGSFGGSIPAILIGTPGAPEAGITTFDGAPMAKNGFAGKALKTALYASCAGNFLSSLTTILMMTGLSKLALMLGPAEYCTVVLFSIVLIATIGSKNNWVKGLFAVMMGLAFGLVGTDPITGTARFTFGVTSLNTGLQLIPVLIGLFVGAELLENVRIPMEKREAAGSRKENNRITWPDVKRCLPHVITGSAIGSIIGALPGLNAAISATLNYACARKLSKHPEEFGKGSIEGVAAAESANNGTVGPTLVPLLTLGIPGSGTAAIFLGALLLQGVTVGPNIFNEHADIVYGIFFSLLLCTIFLAIVGTIFIYFAKYISDIPAQLLGPIIILTCCAGAFSVSNRLFDVGCMLFFMFLGWVMKQLNIPMLPLLISFLLGNMLESNFRRALMISNGSLSIYIQSPICLVFLVITVGMLLWAVGSSLFKRDKASSR
jgi:putative tricarboxylic transport membrane protein